MDSEAPHRSRLERQGVQTGAKFVIKRGVYAALTLYAWHALKRRRDDTHREMRLLARPVAGMAGMQRAVIRHRQFQRCEGGSEFAVDAFCDSHNHKRFAWRAGKVKQ